MGDYGFPLGAPNTLGVGDIGEKNYKNPQQQQNREKKKKEEKSPILPKQDEVILSSNVQAPQEKENESQNDNERDSPEENQAPPLPGRNIDIKI